MKVVVTGKGGAGKTTVAGTLARALARGAHRVVAVDCDPHPNLGVTLGLPAERVEALPAILNGLAADGHTHHDPDPSPDDLLTRFGTAAPDGVTLVATGRVERMPGTCACCGSHQATRSFFGGLPDEDRLVIADLEAGLNDLMWAHPKADDVVVIVADPCRAAVEIARRAHGLAALMGVQRVLAVANRADDGDAAALAAALATDSAGDTAPDTAAGSVDPDGAAAVPVRAVPDDPAIAGAERRGESPLDASRSDGAADSPGVSAIRALAGELVRA